MQVALAAASDLLMVLKSWHLFPHALKASTVKRLHFRQRNLSLQGRPPPLLQQPLWRAWWRQSLRQMQTSLLPARCAFLLANLPCTHRYSLACLLQAHRLWQTAHQAHQLFPCAFLAGRKQSVSGWASDALPAAHVVGMFKWQSVNALILPVIAGACLHARPGGQHARRPARQHQAGTPSIPGGHAGGPA